MIRCQLTIRREKNGTLVQPFELFGMTVSKRQCTPLVMPRSNRVPPALILRTGSTPKLP
ncbi:MAG: hypothetical protein KAS23_05555 [Anaerohalosphaera sp.]|nr:hypothetical protein [Anaerohalosphaera sp.]